MRWGTDLYKTLCSVWFFRQCVIGAWADKQVNAIEQSQKQTYLSMKRRNRSITFQNSGKK